MGYGKIQGQKVFSFSGATKAALPDSIFSDGKVPAFARCVATGAGTFFHDDSQTTGVASTAGDIFEIGEAGLLQNPQAFRRARFTGNWEVIIYYGRGGS